MMMYHTCMRSFDDDIVYNIHQNTHNNSNNYSAIWAIWVPEDHIQTPMGCNKEGILGAGKRILTLIIRKRNAKNAAD